MIAELKPDRKLLTEDATAGITFAVVNIPQAMANALLAGVNPVLGPQLGVSVNQALDAVQAWLDEVGADCKSNEPSAISHQQAADG